MRESESERERGRTTRQDRLNNTDKQTGRQTLRLAKETENKTDIQKTELQYDGQTTKHILRQTNNKTDI